jgi:hypothetical protein
MALDESSRLAHTLSAQVDSVARLLATELASRQARQRLVATLREAHTSVEHKISVAAALIGERTGPEAGLAALRARAVDSHAQSLADIEVYMPVRSQRDRYTGSEELLVAYAIAEGDAPIAYNSQGERVVLSATTPPSEPVLVLTTAEISFNPQGIPSACANRVVESSAIGTYQCNARAEMTRLGTDVAGPRVRLAPSEAASLATFEELCREGIILSADCPQDPEPIPVPADGLYLERSWLSSLHEPWYRGDPEVVLRSYTNPILDRPNSEPVSCVAGGVGIASVNWFDQNSQLYINNPWSPFLTGRGRIASANQLNQIARLSDYHQLGMEVYEDDSGNECDFNEDDGRRRMINAASAALAVYNSARSNFTCRATLLDLNNAVAIVAAAKKFKAAVAACAVWKTAENARTFLGLLGGHDDYIGTVVAVDDPAANDGYSHVIVGENGGVNGRMNLITIDNPNTW